MKLIVVALAGISSLSASLGAQATPPVAENPLLEQLVGNWRMAGQARGRPVAYDLLARRVLNGQYVELHMTDVAHPPQYEALVFIGADTVPNRVLVHWLDKFGAAYSVPHATGEISGDTLRFEFHYSDGPFRDTFVFRRSDHSWIFRLEKGDGHGGWKPFAEYTVRPAR